MGSGFEGYVASAKTTEGMELAKALQNAGESGMRIANVLTDKKTNKTKGIAFVDFDNKEDRDNAVKFNNTKIFGRKISIESKKN